MIIECEICEAQLEFKHVVSYGAHHDGEDVPIDIKLFKCPKCQGPALLMCWPDEEMFGPPERLFPPVESTPNVLVPSPIRSAVLEARACFKAKSYTASAIMCRKALEAICVAHRYTKGNLAQKLNTMRDDEVIENRLFEWADELRISGNEAAHDVSLQTSREDARDILDFTNALIEYVFTFRDKFEQFKQRRENRKTT